MYGLGFPSPGDVDRANANYRLKKNGCAGSEP